jgi:hypothetical protein
VLAKENAVKHYIIIDCRLSDLDFIKSNILNSIFPTLLDLSSVDWLKCHGYACKSIVKEVCELWNAGMSIYEISEKFKLSDGAIWTYLNQGLKLGWCNYKTKSERKDEKVNKCSDLWNSGIKNPTEIGLFLNINRNVVRNYLKRGFELGLCDYTPSKSIEISTKARVKKVLCLDNGIVFNSVNEVEEKSLEIFKVKLIAVAVGRVCNGTFSQYKGFHFKYVD